MQSRAGTDRWRTPVAWLRHLSVVVALVAAAVYVVDSIHWKLMIDSPIMHYVIFLMQHGLKPYTEISDNNMPGAYITEALAMKLFGAGDLGWRLYEFFLLGSIGACMIWIGRRVDWRAGLLGFSIFLTLHAAEGPQYAGERELVITALVMLCYVLLFTAVERNLPWLLVLAGIAGGLAAAIKPTFLPFTVILLLCAAIVQRQRGRSPWPCLLAGLLGLVLTGLLCLGFLLHYDALRPFVFLTRYVVPTYAGLAPPSWRLMFSKSLPFSLLFLFVLCLPLFWVSLREGLATHWANHWERLALALGALMGYSSYLLQRKGFPHHRYAFEVLLFLLIGMVVFEQLETHGWRRLCAACALLFVLVWFTPRTIHKVSSLPPQTQFVTLLEEDLAILQNRTDLNDRVQCFDLVYGCLNALYHRNLVENTGFTGDLLFFAPQPSIAREFYRSRFWELAHRDPASVLVISDQTPLQTNSYDKLQNWPEFAAYIDRNYVQIAQRDFPHERFTVYFDRPVPSGQEDSYRIYIRKDSPLLATAPGLLQQQDPPSRH